MRGLVLLVAAGALACAGAHATPKGPPPEYEDPRAPSWLDAGATTPPVPAAPAPASAAASCDGGEGC